MRRGELRWGNPPLPMVDRKGRPFLIVSNDAFNANPAYPKVMAVHLTSTLRAEGPYDWEVELPRKTAGLTRSSVVKCGEVYTLLKTQLGEPVGNLPRAFMDRVDRALLVALSLPAAE